MGYVQVPYLLDTKIKVTFDGITLNTERQLIAGKLVTTYDKLEENLINISVQTNKIKEILQNYKGTKKQQKELEKQVEEIKENLKKVDELLKGVTDLEKEVTKLKEEVTKLEVNKNNLIEKGKKFEANDLTKINENIETLSNYSAKLNKKEDTGGAIAGISQDTYFDGVINGVSVNNRILSESLLLKDIPITKPIRVPDDEVSFETFEVNNEFKVIVSTSNIKDADFEKLKNETEKTKGIVVWLHYTKDKNQLKYKINYADNYFSKKQDIEIFRRIMRKMLENADITDNWGALVIGSTLGVSTMTHKMIQTPADYEEIGENGLEIQLLEKYYDYLHEKKKKNEFRGNIIEQSINDQEALLEPAFQNNTVDKTWLEKVFSQEIIQETFKLIKETDYYKIGIGVEISGGMEAQSGIKIESSLIYGNIVFLGGKSAGYLHSYRGGELGVGGVTAVSVGGNIGKSNYVAWNHGIKNQKQFQGDYTYKRAEAGVTTGSITGGVDISVGLSRTYAEGTDWNAFALGRSAGIGAGVSTIAVVSGTYGKGNVTFYNEGAVDTSKTKREILKSYIKILFTLGL